MESLYRFIRAISDLFVPLIYNPLPFQFRVFKVEKQGDFQTRDVQIAEHLGGMGFVKSGDHLGIGNDFAFHGEVGDKLANEMAAIINRIFALLFGGTTRVPEVRG